MITYLTFLEKLKRKQNQINKTCISKTTFKTNHSFINTNDISRQVTSNSFAN